MIPKLLTGRGIAGLVDYVTRDKPTPDDPKPTTADRVAHVEALGLPGADPQVMMRCMQGLTADQRAIKQQAGVSTRGRKLREPYCHLMLSCPEGQQPTVEVFRAAVRGALAAIGISERHYGVLTIHQDTDHRHAHAVVSRIDPATGRAAKLTKSQQALSAWAREWEREHGGIVVLGREPGTREQPRKVRDTTGRLYVRTPDERREWSELLQRKHARPERTALNRTQTRRRLEARCQWADRTEAAAPRRLPLGTVKPETERPRRDAGRMPFPTPDPHPDPSLVVRPERERPRRDAGRMPFPTPDPHPDP